MKHIIIGLSLAILSSAPTALATVPATGAYVSASFAVRFTPSIGNCDQLYRIAARISRHAWNGSIAFRYIPFHDRGRTELIVDDMIILSASNRDQFERLASLTDETSAGLQNIVYETIDEMEKAETMRAKSGECKQMNLLDPYVNQGILLRLALRLLHFRLVFRSDPAEIRRYAQAIAAEAASIDARTHTYATRITAAAARFSPVPSTASYYLTVLLIAESTIEHARSLLEKLENEQVPAWLSPGKKDAARENAALLATEVQSLEKFIAITNEAYAFITRH